MTQNCANCFGCIALRAKSYCVLNRQYGKSEYAELVPRIVSHMQSTGEWGRLFPPHTAFCTYEVSYAHDLMHDISPALAKARGFMVGDKKRDDPTAADLPASRLPPQLSAEEIARLAGKKVLCEQSGRIFSLQKHELDFYLKQQIPPPRVHWYQRLQDLVKERQLIPAV